MKKLILMVVMAVVMLVGCGNKPESEPEPVTKTPTEAELVGYWKQNIQMGSHLILFEIEEGGEVYQFFNPGFGRWMRSYEGTISYGDDVRYTVDRDNNEYICVLSEDGNTFYAYRKEDDEQGYQYLKWIRISQEEYDELGVDNAQDGVIFSYPEESNGNEE